MDRIKRFFHNPWRVFYKFNSSSISHILPDEIFLKLMFRARLGEKLDLNNPKTFNEKLQWLKLHDRNPEYSNLVDKYEVREYVKECIGEQYLIPLYGVWNSFDEIDFDSLPNEFVLKCTHDSGSVIICKDKSKFDFDSARKQFNKAMKQNFYYRGREWPYKNVRPRIIAEKYMTEHGNEIRDYKYFCFNQNPEFLYVSEGLSGHDHARISFFDLEGKKLEFHRSDFIEMSEKEIQLETLQEMRKLSESIASLIKVPFVRTDFYTVDNKVFFSEITFFPCDGMMPFSPKEWDDKLGKLIAIPEEMGGGVLDSR